MFSEPAARACLHLATPLSSDELERASRERKALSYSIFYYGLDNVLVYYLLVDGSMDQYLPQLYTAFSLNLNNDQ